MSKKIQFNATSFNATRKIINAYFASLGDLAITLNKCKARADKYAGIIADDKADLMALAMGEDDGIVRTVAEIKKAIADNTALYNKHMSAYNKLVETTSESISKAESLFSDEKSALYKAYVAYAESLTDETYTAYATAMAQRFVEIGLTDATAENVRDYLVNADKALKGKSAVKAKKLVSVIKGKAFAQALLRKIYVTNESMFCPQKFVDYVNKQTSK